MDTASTAWMLASTALVCLMVPGLALFYGGMVAAKSVPNMITLTFGAVTLVGCIWVVYGYSAAFGDSIGGAGILGDVTEYFGMSGIINDDPNAVIPLSVFAAFQALFAALTRSAPSPAPTATRWPKPSSSPNGSNSCTCGGR
ncbi:hypothetical protein ABT300_14995 [Streptomyces sp. NPDC001027]|uniref:hypothetical protein n=1 Tax=Streptomyces sp. NPDC001027 TaxID=3154771 RepID=UPI003330CFE6